MIAAAKKRDRQIPGDVRKNAQVRLPLTWSILAHEYLTVTSSQEWGEVMWLGLALLYFLLCRASTVRVREWARASRFLFDARLPDFLSWRCSG